MTQSSPCAAAEVALEDFQAVSIEGADAIAFAQAQFAADLAQLEVGHWQWSCWLNPQGRAIALLLVLRSADQRLLLLTPGRRADEIAQRLRRFVFRAKVVIETPALHFVGRLGAPASAAPHAHGAITSDDGGSQLQLGGAHGRSLRIAPAAATCNAADAERWRAADVLDGIPWIVDGGVERWIPQALALDRLQAFSVRKGCYPGQEIVARTHFLGRNKRALWRGQVSPANPRPAIAVGERLSARADAGTARPANDMGGEAAADVVAFAVSQGEGHVLVVAREHCPTLLQTSAGDTPVELLHNFADAPQVADGVAGRTE